MVDELALGVLIDNPYQFKTKGEMIRECKNQKTLRKSIRRTMSCAHPTARRFKGESMKHCGTCMPCIIRRAAIRDALRIDPTDYAVDVSSETQAPASGIGADVRAFSIALARLRNNPGLPPFVIHKPGPLPGGAARSKDFVGVYRRGMLEVEKLLRRNASTKT